MRDKDKILEEMQIQIYTYRQTNNGESPLLVISEKFYENLLFESTALHNVKVIHDKKCTILGCDYMAFQSLAFDEFIIGKGFKVTE